MTDITSLLPIDFEITQEILDTAIRSNARHCVGALSLFSALGDFAHGRRILWCTTYGVIDRILVTTSEQVDMMQLDKPQKVTFILK